MIRRFRFLPSYYYKNTSENKLFKSVGKPLRNYQVYGKSSKASEASPNVPILIESVGERTMNLLDVSYWYANFVNEKNGISYSNSDVTTIYGIHLLKGELDETKNYTMRLNYEFECLDEAIDGGIICRACNKNGEIITQKASGYKHGGSGTITLTSSGVHYFCISFNTSKGMTNYVLSDISITEGNTINEYEPYGYKIPIAISGDEVSDTSIKYIYLKEPLRKIREYADYIDFKRSKVVRYVKNKRLSSNDEWEYMVDNEGRDMFKCIIPDSLSCTDASEQVNSMSTHFADAAWDDLQNGAKEGFSVNVNFMCLNQDVEANWENNVEKFNLWLDSNEVYVDYILNTPEEDVVVLPEIPTNKGLNYISIDTKIQPSLVSWQYYRC